MGLREVEEAREGQAADEPSALSSNGEPVRRSGGHVATQVAAAPSLFYNTSSMVQIVLMTLLVTSHCAMSNPKKDTDFYFDAYLCDTKEVAILKGPRHHECWKGQSEKGVPQVSTRMFAVLQEKSTVSHSGWRCEASRSTFSGHCGMFSAWSWAEVPRINSPMSVNAQECQRMAAMKQITLGGRVYKLDQGNNIYNIVTKGDLIYSESSQSFSCDNDRGSTTDDQKRLDKELQLTTYHISLKRVELLVLVNEGTAVVEKGEDRGLELSAMQVASGAAEFDDKTFVLDPGRPTMTCPFAILKRDLILREFRLDKVSQGFVPNPQPIDLQTAKIEDLNTLALVSADIILHLHRPAKVSDACVNVVGPGRRVFETNHHGVLVVEQSPDNQLDRLQSNSVHLEDLDGSLQSASRADLLAFHLDQKFANITRQFQSERCLQDPQSVLAVLKNSEGVKTRTMVAGESILVSKCHSVRVTASWEGIGSNDTSKTGFQSCPLLLPVKLTDKAASAHNQYFLEPHSRFLMRASPTGHCSLLSVQPTMYEEVSGQMIYFNGSAFVSISAKEMDWSRMARKYGMGGTRSFWQDLGADALVTDQELVESGLFREYGSFLTRHQGVLGHHEESISSPAGRRAQGFLQGLEGSARNFGDLAMDTTWGGMYGVFKAIGEVLQSIRHILDPLAWFGGGMYLASRVQGMLVRAFRSCQEDLGKESCGSSSMRAIRRACCGERQQERERIKGVIMEAVQEMVEQEGIRSRDLSRNLIRAARGVEHLERSRSWADERMPLGNL